jgi:hypothetical protein
LLAVDVLGFTPAFGTSRLSSAPPSEGSPSSLSITGARPENRKLCQHRIGFTKSFLNSQGGCWIRKKMIPQESIMMSAFLAFSDFQKIVFAFNSFFSELSKAPLH